METFKITLNDKEVLYLMDRDKILAKLIKEIGDIECSVHSDSFVFLIEQIIGQMISNKIASIIQDRFVKLCEGKVTPENVSNFSIESMREIGLSNSKSKYIKGLAKDVLSGKLNLDSLENMSDNEVAASLKVLDGIGNWTAKMYMLFVLRRSDVLPYEDVAFLQSYRWLYRTDEDRPKEVIERCSCWKPYSSIASRYMYRALDMGMTKNQFRK